MYGAGLRKRSSTSYPGEFASTFRKYTPPGLSVRLISGAMTFRLLMHPLVSIGALAVLLAVSRVKQHLRDYERIGKREVSREQPRLAALELDAEPV